MHERSKNILEATVRGFVELGEPISSGWLYDRHDFSIKPAMIRHELNELTESGYLEQPHHSAGRVPSDKGYRFFAGRALKRGGEVADATLGTLEVARGWFNVLDHLSQSLSMLMAAAVDETVHKGGLGYVLERTEWESRDDVSCIVEDFEAIDDRLRAAERLFGEDDVLRYFIGQGNPIAKSRHLATLIGDYYIDDKRVFLVAVGPKRMDYERTASVFKWLKGRYSRKPRRLGKR